MNSSDRRIVRAGSLPVAGRPRLLGVTFLKYDDSLANAAHDVELSALDDLIEAVPPTLAGVIASMTYIGELPDMNFGRIGGDEIVPLLANLSEALKALAVQA
jgi:hypothetical protein